MMPGARVAAAIEILDDIAQGLAAEQALTRWARRSRFAGSKDRAAIRDYVFDVMRCKRSAAHHGRGETGRALMIGLLFIQGSDIDALFNGEGHAPKPLDDTEKPLTTTAEDRGTRWNLPDWILPEFTASLGDEAEQTADALQSRAPVCLRVNTAKTDVVSVRRALLEEGVDTAPNPLASTALTVLSGERKIRNSQTYLDGLVELQDAASQAVVECLPSANRVLDYCAGGGGKALALAARDAAEVFAHDIDPRRMSDLPVRAARAGALVTVLSSAAVSSAAPFDLVLCDAPCSGSGSWRRAAEGKWSLTQDKLNDLNDVQDGILSDAAALVAGDGTLAYATCSVLKCENEARITAFLKRHSGWKQDFSRRFEVDAHGDGFFVAHLTRVT